MKLTFYIPVVEWGQNTQSEADNRFSAHMYGDLNDLYWMEEDAVGHFEVEVDCITRDEFDEKHGIKRCGAV